MLARSCLARQVSNQSIRTAFISKRFNSFNKSTDDLFVAPNIIAKDNINTKNDLKIDPKLTKNKPLLPELNIDGQINSNFTLSKFQTSVGNFAAKLFRLDMDSVRAGPIAGSLYYSQCKEQGLLKEDSNTESGLTVTATYWYKTLGLEPTFANWFQITLLHSWMLFVRMRVMPFKYGKNYQQKLVDRFFSDMELKLYEELNINSGRIRDQYLKEFHTQLRGGILGYDEGLMTDDITLAYAVWRNLFNAKADIDYLALESVVRYVRMNLYVLSKKSDREFGFGDFTFVSPDEVVYKLTEEQEKELKELAKKRYAPEGVEIDASEQSKLSLDN